MLNCARFGFSLEFFISKLDEQLTAERTCHVRRTYIVGFSRTTKSKRSDEMQLNIKTQSALRGRNLRTV